MSRKDEAAVREWMQRLAALPVERRELPDPTEVWLKAEMLRRWDEQRKAMAPIEVGDRIQVGVELVCAIALLAWLVSRVGAFGTSGSETLAPLVTITLVISAVLLAGAASVVARGFLKRE